MLMLPGGPGPQGHTPVTLPGKVRSLTWEVCPLCRAGPGAPEASGSPLERKGGAGTAGAQLPTGLGVGQRWDSACPSPCGWGPGPGSSLPPSSSPEK